jgi:ATP-binding cassette, subfamily F, member 3
MISINNLSFYLGSRALYDEANLHIKPKDKIGLIGANGTGKSTLLRLINNEYTPDEGVISKANDCSIGFLNQDLLSYQTTDSIRLVAMQAFERALEVERQIEKVLHDMETNYQDKQVEQLARLQEEYDSLDGYTIQAKAEEILEGLGFSTADLDKPLKQFSGGWRMRVMLAKLLLQKPSLLMLDEPTNHLDLPSIKWVENYINTYEGAIIVVSHDRYFLDRTVTSIVEVTQGKLVPYAGNYTFYLEEKALRNEIQKGAFENQQAAIRQTERFIERFRAKATKARQVKSREKALEKMELVNDVIDESAKVNFKFNFSTQPGKFILTLEDISKAYGEKVILKDTKAVIERGDKIALIGANGKGKSTLLRIVDGSEPIEGGSRRIGHNVIDSFYAQHQLESLSVESTILEELKQTGTSKTEMELRGVLGCFLFSGDDAFKRIKVLSGGEKSRVALAKVLISESNFLLLDEPTNHLDMQSVNILIQALQQYEGTYIVVSHDRYFVGEIANKIWYIEDNEIKEYPGTFSEYETFMDKRTAETLVVQEPKIEKKAETPKPAAPSSNLNTHQKKQLENKLKQTEANIESLEAKLKVIEASMADPEIFSDNTRYQQINSEYLSVKELLTIENDLWEKLVEEIG